MFDRNLAHDCQQSLVYIYVVIVLQKQKQPFRYVKMRIKTNWRTNPCIKFDNLFLSSTLREIAGMNKNITCNELVMGVWVQKTWWKTFVMESFMLDMIFFLAADQSEPRLMRDNHHRVYRIWCVASVNVYHSCKQRELYFLVRLDLVVSSWFLLHVAFCTFLAMLLSDRLWADSLRASFSLVHQRQTILELPPKCFTLLVVGM